MADDSGIKIVDNLKKSPAANTVSFLGRNLIAGAELPVNAVSDVGAKVLNTANQFLGGDNNYFDVGNTQRSMNFANTGKYENNTPVPTSYGPNPGMSVPDSVVPVAAAPSSKVQPVTGDNTVTPAAPVKTVARQAATPVIAGAVKKQVGQPDVTVDQYLTQIAGDQAAGRQTGKMPRGVTGSVQVVGDTMDERFQPGPKNGAVLTDAGYYTGSEFGNSPLAAGGGKTRMSAIAGAADQANQFRQQQAVARQQQIAARPQQASVPSVDDYLSKIDPMVRGLSPMRALRLATDARNNDLKMMIAGQEVNQKGQQHAADLQQKRDALAAEQPLHDAQAGYYGAHAKLLEAQSSPEYLMRQERIAQIKDQATRNKEMQKMQQEMATKWVHGQTGMEHPDDIKTAMSYIGAQDTFNQNFDALIDKLAPTARKTWVDGFKAGDPAILEQLSRRGIVKPQAPIFPARTPSTLGMQPQEVK